LLIIVHNLQVNLKYGIKKDQLHYFQETCTACAGSMILEMAALSRLSDIPLFEVSNNDIYFIIRGY